MDLLIILVVLSILIFVHEFGHFIVAKKSGIKVLEFGFGIPPRIIGKKIGETIYSINLFPIGGFVRLFGEDSRDIEGEPGADFDKKKAKERAFFAKSKKVRLAVIIAGVVMNMLLGAFIFSSLYTISGIPTFTDGVEISAIFKGSPAEETFEVEDNVVAINSQAIKNVDEFSGIVGKYRGEELDFEVLRQGKMMTLTAIPRIDPPVHQLPQQLKVSRGKVSCVSETSQEGPLGVIISPKLEMIHYPFWQMPFRGVSLGFLEAFAWGEGIIKGLIGIFSQLACGAVPEGVGGPIEIGFQVAKFRRAGIGPLLNFMAIISINLAIVNLLPIPALDGGRVLFIGLEAITGRRSNERLERIANTVGFAILITLVILISIQDIIRHWNVERITDFFSQ
jgi:regulator of sigma E protease